MEENRNIKKQTANPIAILPYNFNLLSFALLFAIEFFTISEALVGLINLLVILFSIFFYYMQSIKVHA